MSRPVAAVLLGAAVPSRAVMQALAAIPVLPVGMGPDPSTGHACLDAVASLGLEAGFLELATQDPADVARCFHDLRQAYGPLDALVLLPPALTPSDTLVEVSVTSLAEDLRRAVGPWHAVLRCGIPALADTAPIVTIVPPLGRARDVTGSAISGALHGIGASAGLDYGAGRTVSTVVLESPDQLAGAIAGLLGGG